MLKQASVTDIRRGAVTREDGYLVVTMRYYPRFLRRDERDEYLRVMSPEGEVLDQLLSWKRRLNDHGRGWERSRFEERFRISEEGWRELERLVKLSRRRDVFLVCSCGEGQKCHRELLMILARRFLRARVAPLRMEYPEFERRLDRLGKPPMLRARGAALTKIARHRTEKTRMSRTQRKQASHRDIY